MQETFDPYHKWLGIPPGEQPANHYRLLGIAAFEIDADVIEAASDQRMAHVRTYQTGKHSAASQKILNELSAAKICLLNPQLRTAYDANLRQRLAAQAKGLNFGADAAEGDLLAELHVAVSADATPSASRLGTKGRGNRQWQMIGIAAAGLATIVLLILWSVSDNRKQQSRQVADVVASPTAPVADLVEFRPQALADAVAMDREPAVTSRLGHHMGKAKKTKRLLPSHAIHSHRRRFLQVEERFGQAVFVQMV